MVSRRRAQALRNGNTIHAGFDGALQLSRELLEEVRLSIIRVLSVVKMRIKSLRIRRHLSPLGCGQLASNPAQQRIQTGFGANETTSTIRKALLGCQNGVAWRVMARRNVSIRPCPMRSR